MTTAAPPRGPSDRVAVVTGASAGLGRAIAGALARSGMTVLCVSRPGGSGEAVAEELRAAAGHERVRFLAADLSELEQVRGVAARIARQAHAIDILVNNAGAFFARRTVTVDGLEATFALNHLSGFLLTVCLQGELARAAGARVITTSSGAAHVGFLHERDVGWLRGYNGFVAYAQSKLANVLFTMELARRMEDHGVTALAVDPGIVATGFGRGSHALNTSIAWAMRLRGRTPERGAATAVRLALGPLPERASGGLFKDGQRLPLPRAARRPGAAARLWRLSERMCGLDADAGEPASLSPPAGA